MTDHAENMPPQIEWVGEPPNPETLRLWLDMHTHITDEALEEWLDDGEALAGGGE